MWRNIIGLCSQINLLVNINAGNHKEDSGTSRLTMEHPPQSEDHSSLILLDHLDNPAEREGEGDADEDERDESEEVGKQSRSFFTVCSKY